MTKGAQAVLAVSGFLPDGEQEEIKKKEEEKEKEKMEKRWRIRTETEKRRWPGKKIAK